MAMQHWIILALLIFYTGTNVSAQRADSSGIAFADPEYMLSQMPEMKKITADLKALEEKFSQELKEKTEAFEKLYREHAATEATDTEALRKIKRRSLQGMQQRLEAYRDEAQMSLQQKEALWKKPVYERLGKAIAEVARENGYRFILTPAIGGFDVILYADHRADVSDLVLKKLGVAPAIVSDH